MTAPEESDYGRMADPTRPTDDPKILVEITKVMQAASVAKFAVFGVAVPVSIWLTQPIAASLAGKSTTLDITVAVTISIALTITNAGTYAWGRHHRKRAVQAEKRSKELEEKLQAAAKTRTRRKSK